MFVKCLGLLPKWRSPTTKFLFRIVDARQRKIFGGSVLDNQCVHYRLAELKTEVEMLRAALYRAVDIFDE